MTRSKLLPALAVTTALLALGACGSDSDSDQPDAGPERSSTAPAGSEPSSPEDPTATVPTETPAAVAPTTKEPTTQAPSGRLIDYEAGDDSGVTIATAADTRKLTGAPADFSSFIGSQLAVATPSEGCTEAPQIYVSRVDTGGWARGGYSIPQCGGYAALWAKTGGAWTEIWSGQSLVECSTLTKYTMPARVAGASCLEGDETVDYNG